MSWSISEVARMSHTTSRTLRHYDDIGLLRPAYVGANGYRHYGREELLRLQQILLLRELDLPLPVIASIVNGQQDTAAALREHQRRLRKEQARLRRLQRTVERTLAQVDRGDSMTVEDYFDGFNRNQEEDERELVKRYGGGVKEHIAESRSRTAGWSKQDFASAMSEFTDSLQNVAALMRNGHAPDSDSVQEKIDGHHTWLTTFWTPDRASYTGLGELDASEPSFREQIDAVDHTLADFYRDAMAVYAERHLS